MNTGPNRSANEQGEDRKSWSFGVLLGWHLRRGTRPGGTTGRPGRQWSVKAFADATGVGERTVRYWQRDQHLPPEIETIERILFGTDAGYSDWRLELRTAHAATSRREPLPSGPIFFGVPPRVLGFVGRADELDQLDEILIRGRPAALTQLVGRAAVQGLGGIGKTSLAVEYSHRFRDLYTGVWWCPAETRNGLIASLAELAVTLKASSGEDPDLEKSARAALTKLGEARGLWLLVYDNVTEPKEIADLLPSAGARVLITSRFSDWAGWAEEVPVDVLPIEEAVAVLRFRAGRPNDETAEGLAETLGRLPLALDHAAAYCKLTGISFTRYGERVRELMAKAPPGAVYSRSVAATFWLAIEKVEAESPGAVRLLCFFSVLGPDRIPLDLVDDTVVEHGARETALLALTSVSLIKHDPFPDGTPAITVHRLVQAETRSRIML